MANTDLSEAQFAKLHSRLIRLCADLRIQSLARMPADILWEADWVSSNMVKLEAAFPGNYAQLPAQPSEDEILDIIDAGYRFQGC